MGTKTVCYGDMFDDSPTDARTEKLAFQIQFDVAKLQSLQKETDLAFEELKMKINNYAEFTGIPSGLFLNSYLRVVGLDGNERHFNFNDIQSGYYADLIASTARFKGLKYSKEPKEVKYATVPYHKNPAPWTYQKHKPIRCSPRRGRSRRPDHSRLKVKR